MEQYQRQLIAHALLVLIAALLAGFMLAIAVIGGLEIIPAFTIDVAVYGSVEGWARAHTGGITNALMMIAIAFILPHANFAAARAALFAKCFIFIGWANTIFYWFGNAAQNRALSFTDNAAGTSNIFGMIGYSVAIIAALISLYTLTRLAIIFLRR